jgi:hypothetical protein
VAITMASTAAGSARAERGTPALVAIGNGPNGGMGCDDGEALQGQAGTVTKICQGAGGASIGSQIGGIAFVLGANVVGPAQLNGVVTSAGSIGGIVAA